MKYTRRCYFVVCSLIKKFTVSLCHRIVSIFFRNRPINTQRLDRIHSNFKRYSRNVQTILNSRPHTIKKKKDTRNFANWSAKFAQEKEGRRSRYRACNAQRRFAQTSRRFFQTGSSIPKLNLSTALMSQPPPNFGVSQVSPVSISALVSAVRSPAGGQLQPSSGAPMPPIPNMSNMSGMPPLPTMPGSMPTMPTMPSMPGPIRRRISDKSALSLAGGKVSFFLFNHRK